MSAAELLVDYGYTEMEVDGRKVYTPARPSSERWEAVDGGFHCYGLPAAGFGGGKPWGRVLSPVLMQIPFKQSELFANASGLHPADHPDAFEWVWPSERVEQIYRYAPREGANSPQYVKVTDEKTGEERIVVAEKA